jgi:hypothetical protein
MKGENGFLVGDILDVPDDFPAILANQIRQRYGWSIEPGWNA